MDTDRASQKLLALFRFINIVLFVLLAALLIAFH